MECPTLFSLDLYSYSKASRCTTLGTLCFGIFLPYLPLRYSVSLARSLVRELHAARTYPRHGTRLRHLPITAVFPLRVAGPRISDWSAWLRARIRSRFLIPADTHGACMLLRQPAAAAASTTTATTTTATITTLPHHLTYTYTTISLPTTAITVATTTVRTAAVVTTTTTTLPSPSSLSTTTTTMIGQQRRMVTSPALPTRLSQPCKTGATSEHAECRKPLQASLYNTFRHIGADVHRATQRALLYRGDLDRCRDKLLFKICRTILEFSSAACFQIALGANSALGCWLPSRRSPFSSLEIDKL